MVLEYYTREATYSTQQTAWVTGIKQVNPLLFQPIAPGEAERASNAVSVPGADGKPSACTTLQSPKQLTSTRLKAHALQTT